MEAIGQLAGGVAHDFNNLMTVVLGCCGALAAQLKENHPALRRIGMVKKAADSAADLTRQLLAFGRKQILQPKLIEPHEVLGEVEGMLRQLIGENIRLEVNIHAEVGRISADPGQMEQILVNLAANARDAMPNGGRLTIEAGNVDLDNSYEHSSARDPRPLRDVCRFRYRLRHGPENSISNL
jgi:signal transduction histidine kinase